MAWATVPISSKVYLPLHIDLQVEHGEIVDAEIASAVGLGDFTAN
jgi:predicted histidine transporter YuiF (NhaC family)